MSGIEIKTGVRLRSAVSEAEVVVVRAPAKDVVVCCGEAPLVALDARANPSDPPANSEHIVLGKRYVDETTSLELLCTKGGWGTLTVDGRTMTLKGAKPLPSSD